MPPTRDPKRRRSTTSLYLDDVHVSILNGSLHRAVGGEPGRVSDLIVFLQEQLAGIVTAEDTLERGYSVSLTEVGEASWWQMPNDSLHGDVREYARAWAAVKQAWEPAAASPVGAELIALSALTHRSTAWRETPVPSDPVPWFPWHGRKATLEKDRQAVWIGPQPRSPRNPTAERPSRTSKSSPPPTYTVFKRNQLTFSGRRSASPFSIATDPRHHQLMRDLVGPGVLEWLMRHWAGRCRAWQLHRWTDAPLYAAQHAAISSDYAFVPEVLDELEENLVVNAATREYGTEKYGERVLTPPGATRADRLAEAFDVAFDDVIDLNGYYLNDIETPLPQLGVVVMAKRLGLFADYDPATFDPTAFGHRFREALGVAPDADHDTWRDTALAMVQDDDEPIDALPRYGAAAVHADAILHAYLLDRTRQPSPTSLVGLLGRSRSIAWPDRWALHRFVGVPVDAPLDRLRGTKRGGFDLGDVDPAAWVRVNEVLAPLGRSAEGVGYGPFFSRRGRWHPPRGTYSLDGALVEAAVRIATQDLPAYEASHELVEWMRARGRTTADDEGPAQH